MKRLLVADDDAYAVKLMEDLFRKDWEVFSETIQERLPLRFENALPDLVILNAVLRKTEGESMYDAIRRMMPNTPVIVYTPSNMVKLGRDLVKKGAFWNLVTPLNTGDLEHVMKIALVVEQHKKAAQTTRQDFANLEEGIARLTIPIQESLPSQFTLEQDELTQGIVDLLADALQVERVSLMLLDPKSGELRIKAAKGLHPTVIRNTVKRIGEGIAGTVARDGVPLFIRDVGKDQKFSESPYYDQFSTKSLICVPLKTGDRVLGVLNANNKSNGAPFEEHELYLTTIFSHILVMTLQNAQAHHDRERLLLREVQFGQLYRKISGVNDLNTLFTNVLKDCCLIFDADAAVFFLLDEKESTLTAYSWSGGQLTTTELPPPILKNWVASRKQPSVMHGADCKKFMLLPGVIKDAECWISLPVLFKDRRIGSIEMGCASQKRFSERDLQPLALISQQTAMGINTARLYEKLLVSVQEISEARKEVDKIRRSQFL